MFPLGCRKGEGEGKIRTCKIIGRGGGIRVCETIGMDVWSYINCILKNISKVGKPYPRKGRGNTLTTFPFTLELNYDDHLGLCTDHTTQSICERLRCHMPLIVIFKGGANSKIIHHLYLGGIIRTTVFQQ